MQKKIKEICVSRKSIPEIAGEINAAPKSKGAIKLTGNFSVHGDCKTLMQHLKKHISRKIEMREGKIWVCA